MTRRIARIDDLPETVRKPGYDRSEHRAGIVHLGLGAFHKAHQAVYTDDALEASGGDWRITGVSLRNGAAIAALAPQNGLYTVIAHDRESSEARVIGSLAGAHCLATNREPVLDALLAPVTRIVTLTVTEKGYGIDRSTGGIDPAHPAVAADLAEPDHPVGVAGLLVWAIRHRLRAGAPPLTILCCDNLPGNGQMLRALVTDFARRVAPALVEHIANDIGFPSSMVDRITPMQGPETLVRVELMTGHRDLAAVETEGFRQWVIEDDFRSGRPDWEAAGAVFTKDVRPYEMMKLRMLNGTHSLIAYAGFLSGLPYVRDISGCTPLMTLVRRHLDAAADTLPAFEGVDFGAYAKALIQRFSNPHLDHGTYQIAMDGTEKLPQRIFAPALDALEHGQSVASFAFASAAWMRYTLGRNDAGTAYALRDPREYAIAAALEGAADAEAIVHRLHGLPALFPEALRDDREWMASVTRKLDVMLREGMLQAVRKEAQAF